MLGGLGKGAWLHLNTMPLQDKLIPNKFPRLGAEGSRYKRTSDPCKRYNCIAWAAGDKKNWWWPHEDGYWPPGAPMEETVSAVIQAFATLGYEPCLDSILEDKFERIAIFALNGKPTHACYQLPSGLWSSKMGEEVDCQHDLNAVGGGEYGEVVAFLKRRFNYKGRQHPLFRQ